MTKKFTLLQLFSLLDGRMSTKIEDIYEMLEHICDFKGIMTHHLPVAFSYLKDKNPKWFQDNKLILQGIKDQIGDKFEDLIENIKKNDFEIEIPQLKDEFDTSDFGNYMVDNSLLLKIAKS